MIEISLPDCPLWVVCVLALFAVAWLTQVILYFVVWQRPMRLSKQQNKATSALALDEMPGVSVIVYSHNQADALLRNVPVLMTQAYPKFEVIVIDDISKDNTHDVLTMLSHRYANVLHTRIDERVRSVSRRKLAVMLGVKAAHHDIILSTRAQCVPADVHWIERMVRPLVDNRRTEVTLGPVVYSRRASVASRFCQWDLFWRQLQLFALTLTTRPYAGWAQNMAFRKASFYADNNKAFASHLHYVPGEDDLFVAGLANGKNVDVVCVPQAVVTDLSSPLAIAWSCERLDRGFTSQRYALAPCVLQHLDSLSRYLCVLSAWAVIGYAIYYILNVPGTHVLTWEVMGTVAFMLLLRMGLIVWTSVATAKALRQRPYVGWPLLTDLFMPLVDLYYRMKAGVENEQFLACRTGLR